MKEILLHLALLATSVPDLFCFENCISTTRLLYILLENFVVEQRVLSDTPSRKITDNFSYSTLHHSCECTKCNCLASTDTGKLQGPWLQKIPLLQLVPDMA
ncbi:hypothetical protein L218DRAFT_548178 [Marasmius fiardii PR-910]|nr:hypothetical protein L218DRAFT_548178 [Marasmius fiardii PR-910]